MLYNCDLTNVIDASVAKLVDARDLKSLVRKDVPVRLRPEAPTNSRAYAICEALFLCLKFTVAHWWRTIKKTTATTANNSGIKNRLG